MSTYLEEMQAQKAATLDRLDEWIAKEGLTNNIVCQKAGLASSAIFYAKKNGSGVTLKMADRICAVFTRLNKNWLLNGEGNMYVDPTATTNTMNDSTGSVQFGAYNKGNVKTINNIDLKSVETLTQAILNQQDITKKAQEQSDRLIAIIERMQNNA